MVGYDSDDWWDDEPDQHEDDDLSDECGRWDNGALRSYFNCRMAGTEFCDFECPYGASSRVRRKSATPTQPSNPEPEEPRT